MKKYNLRVTKGFLYILPLAIILSFWSWGIIYFWTVATITFTIADNNGKWKHK